MASCLSEHAVVFEADQLRFIAWVLFMAITGLVLLALDPIERNRNKRWPPKKK